MNKNSVDPAWYSSANKFVKLMPPIEMLPQDDFLRQLTTATINRVCSGYTTNLTLRVHMITKRVLQLLQWNYNFSVLPVWNARKYSVQSQITIEFIKSDNGWDFIYASYRALALRFCTVDNAPELFEGGSPTPEFENRIVNFAAQALMTTLLNSVYEQTIGAGRSEQVLDDGWGWFGLYGVDERTNNDYTTVRDNVICNSMYKLDFLSPIEILMVEELARKPQIAPGPAYIENDFFQVSADFGDYPPGNVNVKQLDVVLSGNTLTKLFESMTEEEQKRNEVYFMPSEAVLHSRASHLLAALSSSPQELTLASSSIRVLFDTLLGYITSGKVVIGPNHSMPLPSPSFSAPLRMAAPRPTRAYIANLTRMTGLLRDHFYPSNTGDTDNPFDYREFMGCMQSSLYQAIRSYTLGFASSGGEEVKAGLSNQPLNFSVDFTTLGDLQFVQLRNTPETELTDESGTNLLDQLAATEIMTEDSDPLKELASLIKQSENGEG